ncbi:NEW3 domain-containing protein [Archaeoglobus veneficus]|uniref:Alpha-galactosidase NEW3 domain-containing protein n=1 Tax=Archaeoglobus veneficus (strain DSM 11195 / SNP6) TaxID=693661 RepID=F2KNZ0_ARCVS|nr:NEW3 domain-containing protein [Archaeoglobus veneficus]AEA46298.1 hypothetical protein Arcve_0262 [Archaeoglobus veneficus SNP6]
MRFIVFAVVIAFILTGSVESGVKGVSAVPGETLTFTITVTNDFGSPVTYSLSYSAPDGFAGSFIFDGEEVTYLRLNANESKTIQFQLEVPKTAKEGTYLVWINAGGSFSFRIDIKMPEDPLEIIPSITGIRVEAGDKVSLPITLKNKINAQLEVDLLCVSPKNWSYRFLDGKNEVYRIIMEPNEKKDIVLEIETDSEAAVGEYTVKPCFNKQFVKISVYITKTHRGELGKIKLKLLGKDGRAVDFARIRAAGEVEETVFSSSEGEGLIELPQGKYNIEIVKDGFYKKEIKDVEVRAGKTTDIGIILLEKKPYYADIIVTNPKVSFTLGKGNPLFKFRIENKGYRDDSYKLSVLGLPERFYYRFKETPDSTEGISEVFIRSGESRDVYLEIVVPYNAKVGSYNITLYVNGFCGTISRNLTLSLKGEYVLKVEPFGGRYLITTEPGKVSEFKLIITNSGKGAAITNVKIDVRAPAGWDVFIEPKEIPAIQPGESMVTMLRVVVPADTIPSEYKLEVHVKSDQSAVQEDLRVVVKEKSYSLILGGMIILVSIVSLVLIFRKFGRK